MADIVTRSVVVAKEGVTVGVVVVAVKVVGNVAHAGDVVFLVVKLSEVAVEPAVVEVLRLLKSI